MTLDPVALTVDLIRCPSVTPSEGGALDLLQKTLENMGFTCYRLPFSDIDTPDVDNLYARYGAVAPNFCFAGHTDVVPAGSVAEWSVHPFRAEIKDGAVIGRGAADMKGAIAAFTSAADRFTAAGKFSGSISFLITGDEEGPAINGTKKMLDWLDKKGEKLDVCVVGEPTNPSQLGEMVKIGRRGSMNMILTVDGAQGHVAYPHLADNAAHRLVKMLGALTSQPLDEGNEHFQASSLQITSIDIGNPTENVIPGLAEARFNIRFNDMHTSETLTKWIHHTLDEVAKGSVYNLQTRVSGESFIYKPGDLSNLIADAVEKVIGRRPELSTTGGTSDARFIKNHCPVAEFGLISQTMHKVDEHTLIEDIIRLSEIYLAMLHAYFQRP